MSQTPQEAVTMTSQPTASTNGILKGESKSPEHGGSGKLRFQGCSRISDYQVLGKLGEGTFGEVHKARSLKTGKLVALKKILMHNEKDGFPITALREIKLLKLLSHPNVLKLEEMAVEQRKGEGRKKAIMYMVTPYMDHDLAGLLENPAVRITEPQIKCYMLQLLEGVRYLHASQILHRDMKAANLLINNKGILQIADFGLARPYDDPPPEAGKGGGEARREYTCLVVTRFYRPPELLLQLRRYTTAIDMWGVGCVFGEMFKGRPILAGSSDLNQLVQIFDLVGSPTEETMPGWSRLPGCEGVKTFRKSFSTLSQVFKEQGSGVISLLQELLTLDWRTRINAIDALKHPYFTSPPLPAQAHELPQFEESHELDRRMYRSQQRALPPAPAGGTVGVGPQGEWAQGGHVNGERPPHGLPARGHRHGPENRAFNHPHQSRDGRPLPAPTGDPPRRPAWQTNDSRNLAVPPRPLPGSAARNGRPMDASTDASRPRNGPSRSGPAHGHGDSYVPQYQNGLERPRGNDGNSRSWNNDRSTHEGGRRRSRSPLRHDQINGERIHDSGRDRYRP